MKRTTDLNHPMFQFMLTFKDLVILNLLFILFSIPLITLGASTTALFSVTYKIVENKDNYVAKQFLTAFRENLRQSILTEIILAIPIAVIGFGLFFWASFESAAGAIVSILFLLVLAIFIGAAIYSFPLIGRYENSTLQTIRNALIFCLEYKQYTILFALLIAGGVTLNVFTAPTAAVMCLFGYAFIAYGISYLLLKRVFYRYEHPEEFAKKEELEEDENKVDDYKDDENKDDTSLEETLNNNENEL